MLKAKTFKLVLGMNEDGELQIVRAFAPTMRNRQIIDLLTLEFIDSVENDLDAPPKTFNELGALMELEMCVVKRLKVEG